MYHALPDAASVHQVAAALRAAAALAVLAALAVPRPALAQDTDAPPLTVPDLTVTAEDPLILLPPLGPPVNEAPLEVPGPDRRRAVFRDSPAFSGPGFGPPPAPHAVLRAARSVQTAEHRSGFAASAAVVGSGDLHAVPAALSYRNGGIAPMVELGLSGLVPFATGVAGDVSAHAALQSPSYRGGLGGSLTVAGEVRAGQAALQLGAGNLLGRVAVQSWQAYQAEAEWRTILTAELAVPVRRDGPQAALGLASGWSPSGLFAVPAVRLTYAAPPAWHVAAGVRPMLEYPSWLAHLVREDQASNRALRPERGWLAWLGGGIGGVDGRAGWAHGLAAGDRAEERDSRPAGVDLLLLGAAAEATWHTVTGGPATLAARAGANWDRDTMHWRLRADGRWQIVTNPPISLLLGARWVEARHYHGVYPDEDWTLEIFRDEPGSALIGGIRWAPAWGHRLDLVGGVIFRPAGNLTWGAGIEYGRDVVRLTASQ